MRTDYTAGEVRRLATRAKDAAQARRLLAIAAVLEGTSREDAAEIAGMDRQTLRDWVIRFNERGPDGLINLPSPGAPGKLNDEHKAFLAGIVEEGPTDSVLKDPKHPYTRALSEAFPTIGDPASRFAPSEVGLFDAEDDVAFGADALDGRVGLLGLDL